MNANDTKRSEGQLEHASTPRSGLGRRVRMMVGTAVLATAGLSMSACTPAALVGLGSPSKQSTTKTVSKPKPVSRPKPKPTSIPKTSDPKPVVSSTPAPTSAPTPTPTQAPTPTPTQAPTPTPTQAPTPTPTQAPTPTPTQAPTPTPTQAPTPTPTPPASVAPDASNTGVPAGTRLTVHEGDIVVTTPGTVIDGLDVHGFVKVYAANVTVKNSIIRGGVATSNTGLVNAMSASAVNTRILNNTLVPSNPSIWIDGVFGHDMTVIGNEMYNTVDGIGTFKTGLSDSGMINVDIEGNYIHDLYYAGPDSNHGDNHTHNDGIQIQGGGNIKIVGNTLDCLAGSASNMRSPYYPAATGQAIALTPNVSAIHDLLIDHNWMDGGAQGIGGTVVKPLADNIVISNNHFGQLEWPITRGGTKARWAIVLPNAPMTMTGNVYDGTGYPAMIFRGNP